MYQGQQHLVNLPAEIVVVQILFAELLVLGHATQNNAHDVFVVDDFEEVERILRPQYQLLVGRHIIYQLLQHLVHLREVRPETLVKTADNLGQFFLLIRKRQAGL